MPEWTPRLEANVLLDFEGELRDLAAYEAYGGYAQLKRARAGMDAGHADRRARRLGAARPRRRGLPDRAQGELPGARAASATSSSTPTSRSPGSCKDRELMLRTPHALLEGILIVMNVLRLTRAYIYIRGEYLTEAEVLEAAIAAGAGGRLRRRGRARRLRPGDHGAPRRRRLHLRRGDGAARIAQRLPRPAEREAPVPGGVGRIRAADAAQQRRDHRDDPGDPAPRRRGVQGARHRAERRHARDVDLRARRCGRATTRCP